MPVCLGNLQKFTEQFKLSVISTAVELGGDRNLGGLQSLSLKGESLET